MPLSLGDKLGHYEVISLLGQGGMGEVYKARDNTLKREVALKVLPASFLRDPDRMGRFQREAEVLASLDHPNIGPIYGIIDSEDSRGLVLALIDGPTLADQIALGPLPLDDALSIAKQIVDALEYAHDRGVVHRDLKPANIKITPEGAVKVLDFGLAKVLEDEVAPASDGVLANSPTLTLGHTRAGMILGTAAYMSPEQAIGRPVDRRSDIFSFGAVLFEMLTGKRAFAGTTPPDLLEAVVKSDPDWTALPAGTPAYLRRLLERALTKDRKQRLQAIGEARIAIANPTRQGGDSLDVGQAISSPAGLRRWLWPVVAAIATLALIVAGVLLYNATRPAPLRPLIRVNIDVDDGTPLTRATAGNMLALSPDGARLALTLRGADGKVRLYTRLLNQSQATPLAGTDNATHPFFSPDNEWVGFFADGKLKKIAVEGGAAVTLCDAPSPIGASWGDDGDIIAALIIGVLSRVPSAGGTPVPVTKLNPGELTHRWPQVLPGSQAVLFTASTRRGNYDDANIDVISLKTGERKTVAHGGFSPRYIPSSTRAGHLIYLHQSTLFAVPFDLARLAAAGSPAPILEDVSSGTAAGGDFTFAKSPRGSGMFVYLSGKGTTPGYSMSWVDRSGKTQPLHAPPGNYFTPRFSRDGKRLAFAIGNGQGDDIWVKDLDRDTPSRLSFLPGQNRWPVWTPDGRNIVFESINPAAPGLYWIHSDGSGEAQRLTDGKATAVPYSFSPDGKRLAFHQLGNGGSADIFTAPVEVDPGRGGSGVRLGKAELFLGAPFAELYPAFSRDGRWLAYTSTESGAYEVYVRPFPGPGGRWQISTGGGSFPLWTRDGRELLFETPDNRVMAVDYTANGDSFVAGKPRVWTETRLRPTAPYSNYDLAPDGKRLAAMVADDASGDKPPTHLTFLLNFFDELRRRAPSSK
jgi:Tol biopolymer transport system component/tRNA A-37 threonylcarbamoyl transferase component Bud32